MQRSNIENYAIENGLICEITIDPQQCCCALYEKDGLYIKTFKARFLSEAIEKAVENHRRIKHDQISKQGI